jgi:hypothetical protein
LLDSGDEGRNPAVMAKFRPALSEFGPVLPNSSQSGTVQPDSNEGGWNLENCSGFQQTGQIVLAIRFGFWPYWSNSDKLIGIRLYWPESSYRNLATVMDSDRPAPNSSTSLISAAVAGA